MLTSALDRTSVRKGTSWAGERKALPLEVYCSLVDALYEIVTALVIGSTATTIAVVISAWQAKSPLLLGFAVAIAVATALRLRDVRTYKRLRPTLRSAPAFQYWERRYVVSSLIYVSLMSGWCLACFIVTEDPVVRLLSFAVIVAYLIGVSGRNFASNSLVVSQILSGGLPIVAALIYAGGLYIAIIPIVLLPFFASMKMIADRLRRQLLSAVVSAVEITQLAARFTTALNNMPHGLIMFDSNRRLLVANERLLEILRLPRETLLTGMTARELWELSEGFHGSAGFDEFATAFESQQSGEPAEVTVKLDDDRWLAFATRPMENGGSVVIVEDITERQVAEQRIQRMARYDGLTGLPNRNHFHEKLEVALPTLSAGEALAVLFVDLDKFKQVNDTLGHPAGDQLLNEVADRLRANVPKGAEVARFGGDEFVVMQRIERGSTDMADLAPRLLDVIAQPYEIDGQDIIIGASIGIATAPADGTNPDTLLRNADMALYSAKASGRAGWRAFDRSMDDDAQARRAMELDLRQALLEEQFELYYQPLLHLKTMRVQTCEALLRWNHPIRGMVPPGQFIPVAEDIGIIKDIGDWVIRKACKECAQWPADVSVAVNLSAVQFRRVGLADVIADALKEAGLPPRRLEIEITESVLLRDTPGTRAILQVLAEMGVRISLDDFGTGYSALSYLLTFPLNKVKIDRSFVVQLHSGDRSLTLLKGVARLSAALGLSVVVEGVETQQQLAAIAAEDSIDEAQGYLFSVPLPVAQIRAFVASHAAKQSRDLPVETARKKRIV